MNQSGEELPVPELRPRRITIHQYQAYAPEKFELIDGYLFYGPDYPEHRHQLLRLLLVNVGLLEAVKLVPEGRWREALQCAYRSGGQPSV